VIDIRDGVGGLAQGGKKASKKRRFPRTRRRKDRTDSLPVREVAQPIQTLLEGLRLEGPLRFEVFGERIDLRPKKPRSFDSRRCVLAIVMVVLQLVGAFLRVLGLLLVELSRQVLQGPQAGAGALGGSFSGFRRTRWFPERSTGKASEVLPSLSLSVTLRRSKGSK